MQVRRSQSQPAELFVPPVPSVSRLVRISITVARHVTSLQPPPVLFPSADGLRDNEVLVQGTKFTKLDQIGKGGSSVVFRVLGPDRKMYAMKEVDLSDADAATIEGYENEIALLERLRGHSSIIKLVAHDKDATRQALHIVMECGDADLATMLRNRRQERRTIDDNHLRLLWQQMLEAVLCIHQQRIVHSDLKPANFLFVSGALKLIDFGIAKGIQVR